MHNAPIERGVGAVSAINHWFGRDSIPIGAYTGPDGPRGPARILAAGPVSIAQMAGKPIVPMCWSVDRYWRASGWDRLIIPKPFARGQVVMGQPMRIEKLDKAGLEAKRKAIETTMNEQADMIDIAVTGHAIR